MTKLELIYYLEDNKSKLRDPDGFDLAFYQGAEHILKQCGDGGLSEQYFAGIEFVLNTLTPEELIG